MDYLLIFIVGLSSSFVTFVYAFRIMKRIYHPIIQAQQAALQDYENARSVFSDKPD
jgi:hypothetical protein